MEFKWNPTKSQRDLYEQWKQEILNYLVNCGEECEIRSIPARMQEAEGQCIPFRTMGFFSLNSFLYAMALDECIWVKKVDKEICILIKKSSNDRKDGGLTRPEQKCYCLPEELLKASGKRQNRNLISYEKSMKSRSVPAFCDAMRCGSVGSRDDSSDDDSDYDYQSCNMDTESAITVATSVKPKLSSRSSVTNASPHRMGIGSDRIINMSRDSVPLRGLNVDGSGLFQNGMGYASILGEAGTARDFVTTSPFPQYFVDGPSNNRGLMAYLRSVSTLGELNNR